MAIYTPAQLKANGTPTEELSGSKLFTFDNPSSSAYFTLETVRNSQGVYDTGSATNAIGTYENFADSGYASTSASLTFDMVTAHPTGSFSINTLFFDMITGSLANTATTIYISSGSTAVNTAINIRDAVNNSGSLAPYVNNLQFITASVSSTNITLTFTGSDGLEGNNQFIVFGGSTSSFAGGANRNEDGDNNGLVTSSYIFGINVPPGESSFNFTPAATIAVSSSMLRGTGEYSLNIT